MERQSILTKQMKKQKYTASAILYLLLSFPLGLVYFLFLIIGLSVGLGTIILWIGIPILLITLAGIRGMAALERDLAANMLHTEMPAIRPRISNKKGLLAWAQESLSNPLTWRSIIYVIVKLPLGIISFSLALTLPILALGLITEPLVYLLNVFIIGIIQASGHHSQTWLPFFVHTDGSFEPLMLARSFIGIPFGLGVWYVSMFVLNGLAYACGEFTRALLCPEEQTAEMPKDEQYVYQSYAYQQREQY